MGAAARGRGREVPGRSGAPRVPGRGEVRAAPVRRRRRGLRRSGARPGPGPRARVGAQGRVARDEGGCRGGARRLPGLAPRRLPARRSASRTGSASSIARAIASRWRSTRAGGSRSIRRRRRRTGTWRWRSTRGARRARACSWPWSRAGRRSPRASGGAKELLDRSSLAVLDGDFELAVEHARAWQREVAGRNDQDAHASPALKLAELYREMGLPREAGRVADDFLRRMSAWSGAGDHGRLDHRVLAVRLSEQRR